MKNKILIVLVQGLLACSPCKSADIATIDGDVVERLLVDEAVDDSTFNNGRWVFKPDEERSVEVRQVESQADGKVCRVCVTAWVETAAEGTKRRRLADPSTWTGKATWRADASGVLRVNLEREGNSWRLVGIDNESFSKD